MPSEASWRSWLARRPVTAEVAGSSPVWVATASGHEPDAFGQVAQLVERPPEKRKVGGSTPSLATPLSCEEAATHRVAAF